MPSKEDCPLFRGFQHINHDGHKVQGPGYPEAGGRGHAREVKIVMMKKETNANHEILDKNEMIDDCEDAKQYFAVIEIYKSVNLLSCY